MNAPRRAENAQLHLYADAIQMWRRGFDTQSIADRLRIPEHQAARWIADYRDAMRAQ